MEAATPKKDRQPTYQVPEAVVLPGIDYRRMDDGVAKSHSMPIGSRSIESTTRRDIMSINGS